jgi:transposase
LRALAPFRHDVVLGCECLFGWYRLADRCAQEGLPFVLGHALYMRLIHGAKAKNDRIDANKIARLLRGEPRGSARAGPQDQADRAPAADRVMLLVPPAPSPTA